MDDMDKQSRLVAESPQSDVESFMRFVFFLILLIGVALGIVYPWAIQNFSGRELGTWRVYDRASGFHPVDVTLGSADAPVRALVDMTLLGTRNFSGTSTALTITADGGGRTVLAETLSFATSSPREESPQMAERIYRDDAGLIPEIADGTYTFTVGPGDADGIDMKSVDLILRSSAGSYDQRAQPVGFTLMAIGFIGFVLALRNRRGGTPGNPNSQPPPPRWGRG